MKGIKIMIKNLIKKLSKVFLAICGGMIFSAAVHAGPVPAGFKPKNVHYVTLPDGNIQCTIMKDDGSEGFKFLVWKKTTINDDEVKFEGKLRDIDIVVIRRNTDAIILCDDTTVKNMLSNPDSMKEVQIYTTNEKASLLINMFIVTGVMSVA